MSSALSTYGFVSAKLKTRISKTLPPDVIERLVRAGSLVEAMQLLRGTAFAAIEEAYAATGDLLAGEALVVAREIGLYTSLFRYFDEPVLGFVESLALRFEIDKLKNAIRLWFDSRVRGRTIDGRSGYVYRAVIVNNFDVDALVRAPDADGAIKALEGTPYAAIAREKLPVVVAGRSVFPFEMALDRYYYDVVFAAAARLGSADRTVAERVLGIDVDMQNVSWLVRAGDFQGASGESAMANLIPRGRAIDASTVARAMAKGAPAAAEARSTSGGFLGIELLRGSYGSIGALLGSGGNAASRLAFLEGALRQISADEAGRSLAGYPFSIGIVLAYFTRAREELRTVMTILNAKNYAMPEERIRSAL
jgi:V/A-type H+-transporting ATPase subunit C